MSWNYLIKSIGSSGKYFDPRLITEESPRGQTKRSKDHRPQRPACSILFHTISSHPIGSHRIWSSSREISGHLNDDSLLAGKKKLLLSSAVPQIHSLNWMNGVLNGKLSAWLGMTRLCRIAAYIFSRSSVRVRVQLSIKRKQRFLNFDSPFSWEVLDAFLFLFSIPLMWATCVAHLPNS